VVRLSRCIRAPWRGGGCRRRRCSSGGPILLWQASVWILPLPSLLLVSQRGVAAPFPLCQWTGSSADHVTTFAVELWFLLEPCSRGLGKRRKTNDSRHGYSVSGPIGALP
jgi:hypothetical protein